MKRFLSVLLAGILSFCTACTPAQAGSNGGAASAAQGAEGEARLISSYLGTIPINTAKDGAYQLASYQSGMILTYIDYQTQTRTVLCSRPECTHQDDTCAAWFQQVAGYAFADDESGHLFVMTSADDRDETPQILWKMDLNGQNRTKFITMKASDSLGGEFASDGQNLYFTIQSVAQDGQKFNPFSNDLVKTLCEVNIDSGKTKTLLSFSSSSFLAGAFDRKLVLLRNQWDEKGNSQQSYSVYDLDTAKEQQVFNYTYTGGKDYITKVKDAELYFLQPTQGDFADVKKVDLRTGQKTTLYEGLPYYGSDISYIRNIEDGKIVIEITNTNNGKGPIDHHTYVVDEATGELGELKPDFAGGDPPLIPGIVGVANSHQYLVDSGYVERMTPFMNEDGTTDYAPVLGPQYTLIEKEDYWNSIPNFITVKDNTMLGIEW